MYLQLSRLLIIYRALLIIYMALLIICRALLIRALLCVLIASCWGRDTLSGSLWVLGLFSYIYVSFAGLFSY